jgi:hypothetical protein
METSRINKGLLLLVALACLACGFTKDQQGSCKELHRKGIEYLECYKHSPADSCLSKASLFADLALRCDSLRPAIYWLKLQVHAAVDEYDSVIYYSKKFERISKGPDLMFAEANAYRKLGHLDSAKSYKKSVEGYDHLLKSDSMNFSLVLGKLQAILYLDGRKAALRHVEYYKEKYGRYGEFSHIDKVPLVLDSIH